MGKKHSIFISFCALLILIPVLASGCVGCCHNKNNPDDIVEERLQQGEALMKSVDPSILEYHKEDDGFVWYSFERLGLKGIADKDGNVLVEDLFSHIGYLVGYRVLEAYLPSELFHEDRKCIIGKDFQFKIGIENAIFAIDRLEFDNNEYRCYYRAWSKNENGHDKYGIYDRDWLLVVPPCFNFIELSEWKGEGIINRFFATIDNKKIPLDYSLDYYGKKVELDHPKHGILYNANVSGENWVDINRSCICLFYDDYICNNNIKCPYSRTEGDLDVYEEAQRDIYGHTESKWEIYVDKGFNIVKKEKIFEAEHFEFNYDSFETLHFRDGQSFLEYYNQKVEDVMDEYKRKQEEKKKMGIKLRAEHIEALLSENETKGELTH